MKQGSVVFDSFAVLSFLKGEPGCDKVKEHLLKVHSKQSMGYISAVNLCEVYYIVMREKGCEDAEILTTSLKDWGVNVVLADEDTARRAGQLKAQYPISLADAFAAATSQILGACLLSGDPEFQQLKGKVEIEWIG